MKQRCRRGKGDCDLKLGENIVAQIANNSVHKILINEKTDFDEPTILYIPMFGPILVS